MSTWSDVRDGLDSWATTVIGAPYAAISARMKDGLWTVIGHAIEDYVTGGITDVLGTSDEIDVSGTGPYTISLPDWVIFPGQNGIVIPRNETGDDDRPSHLDGTLRFNRSVGGTQGLLEVYISDSAPDDADGDGAWYQVAMSSDIGLLQTSIALLASEITTLGDHASLSHLAWTSSGHTGTASRIAGFNGSGAAAYYQLGVDIQAYSSVLTTYAGIAPSANVQTLLGAANYAAIRADLSLVVGTNVEAWSATLDAVAAGTYVGAASITTLGTVATGTWNGTAIAVGYGGTGIASYTLGDLLYASATTTLAKLAGNTTGTKKFLAQTGTGTISAAPSWGTIAAGDVPDLSATYLTVAAATAGYQPLDADLTAIAALAGTGIAVQTAAGTWALRSLVQPSEGLVITNPGGVAGNPQFALANDLAAVEALTATSGFAARIGADTWALRNLVQPAAGLTISNPGGVAGSPTFALANDLAALEALGNGYPKRTGVDTWSASSTIPWSDVSSTPTTVAGYGITDGVVGPASATDGAIALYNGTGGKTIKDSALATTSLYQKSKDTWFVQGANTAAPFVLASGVSTSSGGVGTPAFTFGTFPTGRHAVLTTSGSSGDSAFIATEADTAEGRWSPDVTIQVRTPATLQTGCLFWVGLFQGDPGNTATPTNHHIGFRFKNGTDTGWTPDHADGTTHLAETTIGTVSTGTSYTLRLRSPDAGVTWYLSVNGGAETTCSSNLPGTGQSLSFMVRVYTNTGATQALLFHRASGDQS